MATELPEFLDCPFCGRQPKIEIQLDLHHYTGGAWAWLRCNCEIAQHQGVHRSALRQTNYPYGPYVRYRSDEEAGEEAAKDLARCWNKRAGEQA